jgi:cytochrome oxidase Cu insertion factor (SCO1/SenC/PrrC family)
VLAYVMFFFIDVKSFNNHGELLNPILHIKDFKLRNADQELIPEKELTYKWRLVSFVGSSCDKACADQLHDTRQVYRSLGKNRHRVMQMLVHLEEADPAFSKLIQDEHAEVIRVHGTADEIAAVIGSVADFNQNQVYVMDPMGNVMMRFTADQPNKDFLYDLRKLLKASQIG